MARHAYWFPLVLFGVLICASAPFYIQPSVPAGSGQVAGVAGPSMPLLGGFSGLLVSRYLGYYWLTALFAGLLLTLLWYRRHARQVGLATPARGYVITGAVLTVLAFLLPPLSQVPWLRGLQVLWPGDLVVRGTFPFLIIAAGLWVLAWAERSRALAVIAPSTPQPRCWRACTTSRTSCSGSAGIRRQWRLTSLPGVLLPAFVLLAAGASAFAVQRPHRAAR